MNRRQILHTSIAAALFGSLGTHDVRAADTASGNSILRPRRLRTGDTVGLIAPASPAWDDERIRFSGDLIRSFGFVVKEGAHLYDRDQYLAGNDRDRASDVNEMFADESVNAIFSLRGGYGTPRILPYIDYDMIARNPKVFIGYSDLTGLLIAIHQRTGLIGFHGPSVDNNLSDYALAEFTKILMEPTSHTVIGEAPPITLREGFVERRNRVTRYAAGTADGRLTGGNLTLVSTLMGTPYEPDFRGRIVFLEDVNEAPYRIDRMLTQLWLAGKLQHAAGIAFGKFTKTEDEGNTHSVEEIIRHRCSSLGIPVVSGLMIGHIADKTVVPIGVMARLDADSGSLELLEPAVT